MQGRIQGREFSRNGKLKLKIDNRWYFVGKCNADGLENGMQVEFDSNTFGNDPSKPLYGLNSIRPMSAGSSAPASNDRAANGRSAPPPSDDTKDRQIFVSALLKSALEGGHIKTKEELLPWARASVNVFKAINTTSGDSGFRDDDMPPMRGDDDQGHGDPDMPPW